MTIKRIFKENWYWIPTAITLFIVILPVWWIISSSITPADRLFQTPVRYFPANPTLDNYRMLFSVVPIGSMITDTMFVTLFTILLSNIMCMMAAYGFTHTNLKIVKLAFAFLVASSFLPTMSTLIPMFQMFATLGLHDTRHGLILLYISSFSPFAIVIITTFMRQIPRSLEEAALVDGANVFVVIFRILLPVMKPAITTMSIIKFILCLNEFMIPLVFTSRRVSMISVGLTMVPRIDQFMIPWDLISALVTIIIVPIIVFVVAFEKNIMSGLMAGSVKQ